MYKQETIQPTIIISNIQALTQVYLSDTAPPTHTHKNSKEIKEKRDRVVSSPSSCPPRSGFAHDPKSFLTITDPARLPSVRSATSLTIFRGDPASTIQRARAMQRQQSSLAILLASEPPSFSLQHKLSRARVPPLYHQAPPPFHLPPLLLGAALSLSPSLGPALVVRRAAYWWRRGREAQQCRLSGGPARPDEGCRRGFAGRVGGRNQARPR